MDDSIGNNDWKKEAPKLGALPVRNPFCVPEKYFDELPIRISNEIYLNSLKEEVNATGFDTPKNYFDDLNRQISAAVSVASIKALVPPAKEEVHEGFFEHQRLAILSKTVQEKKAYKSKVIRLWHSSLLKYASAACFIILSATGIYFYEQQSVDRSPAYADMATEQMLYDIEEQVIIDHIQADHIQKTQSVAENAALENYILNNYSQSDLASDF